MKHALTGLLLAGVAGAFISVTPALAQVAGNPGDSHTPTVYTSEYNAQHYDAAPGAGGAFGPLGVLASPSAPGGGGCGVIQDFNGRYTALCGL
jgi:hypothetical protein